MKKLNVFSEMSQIVRIFDLFAIGPASPHTISNWLSKIYLLISGIAVLSIFTSAIFINRVLHNLDQPVMKHVCFGSLLFTHLIIILQLIFYRNQQYQIFLKLSEIDTILMRELKVKISYVIERYRCYKKIGIFWAIVCLIETIHMFNAFRTTIVLIHFIHCLYSFTIIRLTCIQIIFYVNLLVVRIELVNKKLEDFVLAKNLRLKSQTHVNRSYRHFSNSIFTLPRFKGENASQLSASIVYQLTQLKWIYTLLYDLHCLINTTFGWPLLIITLQYFIDFTLNGYWLFLALRTSEPDYRIVIDCLCILMPIILLLWMLCYWCYTCSQMVII